MKKSIIIIALAVIAAVSGFTVWKYSSVRNSSCTKTCEIKSGSYNLKMSLCCERACAAKNVDVSKVVAQLKAKVGNYTKCPVSGVVFLVTEQSSKVSYKNL